MNIERPSHNVYDAMLLFSIVSCVLGTVQFGIISHSLILGLICLPFAVFGLIKDVINGKMKGIIFVVVMLLLYATSSVIWGFRSPIMFQELWFLFWNINIFVGLYYISQKALQPREDILKGWELLIALTMVVAFWEILTNSHIPQFGDFNAEQSIMDKDGVLEERIFAAVTYKNLNSYVTLLCMAIPLLMLSIFQLKHTVRSICIALLAMVLVIINSSRGGFMCLFLFLLVLFLFYPKINFAHKKALSVLGIGMIVVLVIKYGLAIAQQSLNRFNNYGTENIMDDPGRYDVWQMGLDFCVDSFGFGCGVGSMQSMYEQTGFWLHYSHNIVIEFILQYGIYLGIPFFLCIFLNWLKMIKATEYSDKAIGWMWLLSFVPLVIIDDTYLTHPYVWVWLLSQFVLTAHLQKQDK